MSCAWHPAARGGLLSLLFVVLCLGGLPGAAGALEYHDVTGAAGIAFRTAGEVHEGGPGDQWPAFTEILGGGACWGDFDSDGLQDLYLVNHRYNPHNPAGRSLVPFHDPRDALYRNLGGGRFVDVTEEAGIGGREPGYSCAVADADGDFDLDLFVGNLGRDRFWLNDGSGRFVDHTEASGIGAGALCRGVPCVTQGAAWADYDRDGDVDLYVTNYVETNETDTQRGPGFHVGQENRLYRNRGDAVFDDVAVEAGVAGNPTDVEGSKSFQAVWDDFDGDGDLDLYVTNDSTPNDYYENRGDGTFVERSNESGLADPRAGMGLSAGDFDGDCLPDLFFTHYQRQDNGLYRNRGDGTFEDLSGAGDHRQESNWRVGWGTHFVDVDLDGDLDILTANGHTEWGVDGVYNTSYAQQIELFRNDAGPDGSRDWVAVHDEAGPSFDTKWVGRGLSVGDMDLDGDLDFVIVPNANQTATLHEARNVPGHWLRVELRDTLAANTLGIGALVELQTSDGTQCRRVYGGSGFLGQNDLGLNFGLADGDHVERLSVRWPTGPATTVHNLPVDRVVRVGRDGGWSDDTVSPLTAMRADPPSETGWWHGPVALHFDSMDRGATTETGVVERKFRINHGPWIVDGGTGVTLEMDGVHTVEAQARDAAGNVEPVRKWVVGIDRLPPLVSVNVAGSLGENGWYVGPAVEVGMSAFDDTSGVAERWVRVDDGAWRAYGGPLVLDGAGGVYDVAFRAADQSGLVSSESVVRVRHDPVPPEVKITRPAPGEVYVQGIRIPRTTPVPDAFLVSGPGLHGGPTEFEVRTEALDQVSGLVFGYLVVDGVEVARGPDGELGWLWTMDASQAGEHRLVAGARDAAGNSAQLGHTVHVVAPGPGMDPAPAAPAALALPGGSAVAAAATTSGAKAAGTEGLVSEGAPGAGVSLGVALLGVGGLWRRHNG